MDASLPINNLSTPVSSPDWTQPAQPVRAPERKLPSGSDVTSVSSELSNTTALKQTENIGEQINISNQQVLKAIEKAIKAIEGKSTALQFSIHEDTKRIMVKVMNKESGEVIREIPPEKNLDFLVNLWEQAGILMDERR
ncbi:flagellar protein FlaG [Paenibacillus abyssi]|uniref:Flagellar biosynthesis protein FlaG n=1 Tax=Paenibacillus abyssi TaxID=1340531 RepID=A0A917CKP7_9BACL|nr:flagellar protein FlaG [Paenibacillus abyssi]GGF91388.1 hypothetical protein GCM10010916_05820 [Paenibacillus abyssi]